MIAATTLVFDTTGLKPIQPSGFVPPSQRTDYSDPLVQDLLKEAFGDQFPKLESVERNTAIYRHDDPAVRSLVDCVAAQSIQDIPQAEIMRLLQGWIVLRKIVIETTVPQGVRSLLMNLQVPDPRVAPRFYRVSGSKNEEKKLFVLIGFEGPDAPSMALEEAIATMLNVKPSQLESLLATSMGSSVPVTPRVTTVQAPASVAKPSAGAKNAVLLCSSAALLIFAVGTVWKLNARPSHIQEAPPAAITPPSTVATPTAPALQPVAVESPPTPSIAEATKLPVAPLSKPAPLPTLDAMTTGVQPETTPSHATSPAPQPSPNANLTDLMAQ
jgi:hypothetical protein